MKEIYCKVNEAPGEANTDITTFLKENNTRISCENKWLVWSDALCRWQVYQQEYHKQVKCIYEGDLLAEALQSLVKVEGDIEL